MGDEEKAMYFAIAEKEKLNDPQPKKRWKRDRVRSRRKGGGVASEVRRDDQSSDYLGSSSQESASHADCSQSSGSNLNSDDFSPPYTITPVQTPANSVSIS